MMMHKFKKNVSSLRILNLPFQISNLIFKFFNPSIRLRKPSISIFKILLENIQRYKSFNTQIE